LFLFLSVFLKESEMALAPNLSLSYGNYKARLQAAMYPPAKVPIRVSPDGPLDAVKYIGPFFSRRFASFTGVLGPILTPRQLARLLHTYVSTPLPGVPSHHERIRRNLKNIISVACQNPSGMCTRNVQGPPRVGKLGKRAGKMLPGLMPYFKRDVYPGCALASAALFDILYSKTATPHVNLSQATATAMAAQIANHFTRPRAKVSTPLVPSFSPSASCPCITDRDVCNAAPYCSYRPAVPGAGVAGFPNSGACVPSKVPAVAGDFPGILSLEGQSFPMARKVALEAAGKVVPRRVGSSYASYPPTGSYWRRRLIGRQPTVQLPGVPPWPA
jgi:hypothetical protein